MPPSPPPAERAPPGLSALAHLSQERSSAARIRPRPALCALAHLSQALGPNIAELAGFSPTLLEALAPFFRQGGKVAYGPKGGGSCHQLRFLRRGSHTRVFETLLLDAALRGHPPAVIQALSHEAGHVAFPFKPELSSWAAFVRGLGSEGAVEPKVAYMRSRLKGEGAAVVKNLQVRRELASGLGVDIGLAGNPDNHRFYAQVYAEHGNSAAAWKRIGAKLAATEGAPLQPPGSRHSRCRRPISYYTLWEREFEALMAFWGRARSPRPRSPAPTPPRPRSHSPRPHVLKLRTT